MAKASLVGILCDRPHLSHRKGLNLVKFIKTVIFIVVFFKLCEQAEVTGSKLWQVGRVWEQWRLCFMKNVAWVTDLWAEVLSGPESNFLVHHFSNSQGNICAATDIA